MKKAFAFIAIMGVVGFTLATGAEQARTDTCRYESHGKRDPFTPLVGQGKSSAVVSLEDVATISDVKLEGIASSAAGDTVAILNGQIVKMGATVGQVQVQKIDKRSVTLAIGDKLYTVNLFEERGAQGE